MTAAGIEVAGLSIVSPAGVTLLRDASFSLAPGRILVIVGPSGSGKTSLIRLLCGLLPRRAAGWQVSGMLLYDNEQIDLSRHDSRIGGMVFQSHALFDDLTVGENLRIVADHRRAAFALTEETDAFLADIDPGQTVMASSGGQRQRLAIARTLLADPALLLFDEPNAGLDMGAARRLVGMIRDLCRQSNKPAIIVAHHVDEFISLADQIMVLDPHTATLHEVAVDRQAIERAMLGIAVASEDSASASLGYRRPLSAWARRLPRRPRIYWFLRYLGEYLWILFAAPSMLLFTILGSAIVGFVTVWFGFNYNSFGGYLRAILHDETLEGLGFVLTTVAVPFNTCILVIARNSAIIAADLGNRVSGMQLQAMQNLHLPGRAYIIASIMISLVVGSLFLVAAALVSAFASALLTWHYLFPGQATGYWQEYFFRKIMDPGTMGIQGFWVVLKVTASAVLGGAVAIFIGLRPSRSPGNVVQLIASAIISGVSLTLLVHAVLLILQF